jgi:hypothetical protein
MRFIALSGRVWLAGLLMLGACTPSTPPAEGPPGGVILPPPASTNGGATSVGGSASGGSGDIGTVGGASTAHEQMCGGIAGLRCPEKQFCSYAPEAHCGAADMSGTCAPKPEVCAQVVDEVCGCDDKTYSNACMAAQAGVSVVMKGACAKPASETIAEGGLCGTRGVNKECAPDLYCAYKSQCGATDAGGTCTKRPQICTKIYAPVCGCDGKTYGSACTAAAAGVSVATKGECGKHP